MPQIEVPRALDYGTDHRLRRIRLTHIVVGLVLTVCVGGSWLLGRSARAQAQTLLYMKQAARHVEQDSTVIFEGDPEAARRLIEAGTHHALNAAGEAAVINNPESLQVFRDAIDAESFDAVGALAFLHELTTPSGMRRVVVVHYLPQYINGHLNPQAGLIAHIFEPGGLLSRPRLIGESRSKLLISADRTPDSLLRLTDPEPNANDAALSNLSETRVSFGEPEADLEIGHMGLTSRALQQAFDPWGRPATARWYAGQPDQDDPSHFTIQFELDGRAGTIDGFLTDDGRHVRMQSRPTGGFAHDSFNRGLRVGLPHGF